MEHPGDQGRNHVHDVARAQKRVGCVGFHVGDQSPTGRIVARGFAGRFPQRIYRERSLQIKEELREYERQKVADL